MFVELITYLTRKPLKLVEQIQWNMEQPNAADYVSQHIFAFGAVTMGSDMI